MRDAEELRYVLVVAFLYRTVMKPRAAHIKVNARHP